MEEGFEGAERGKSREGEGAMLAVGAGGPVVNNSVLRRVGAWRGRDADKGVLPYGERYYGRQRDSSCKNSDVTRKEGCRY